MIRFDEGTHTYWLGQQLIPGVTSVLKMVGGYEGVPEHILNAASERGRAVHLATEFYDDGDLDEDSLHESLRPYLDAWKQFRADTGFVVTHSETMVYHPRHRYAGTLDRVGDLNKKRTLLDIKTTVDMMPATALQTAAYKAAFEFMHPETPIEKRVSVQLRADGTYRMHTYDDPSDLAIFLSALNLHNWILRNKK